MHITTVLFDLDGTLLPMDNDEFTNGYFKFLVAKMAPYGYEPKKLIDTIWTGTYEMVRNDGSVSNEEAFWRKAAEIYGQKVLDDKHLFEEFYSNEFQQGQQFCGYNPLANEAVSLCKALGYRVALATNPLFPEPAQYIRIGWAGLHADDFELITNYTNTNYCKPNPAYFQNVADRLGVEPAECLMVGNDAWEDTVSEKIGMHPFLITDWMINKKNADIDQWPHGGFEDLMAYLRGLKAEG